MILAEAPTTAAVPFARDLARHGDRPAMFTGSAALTYRKLARLVSDRAARLGPRRRLVLLAGGNDVETIVTYLAALSVGHPLLLAPGDNPAAIASLQQAYQPDVVATADGMQEIRADSAHDLNPQLALLLSTSGSTGSPKLVRLSHENLHTNAESIAGYLGITAADRAMTMLPMHYCYGLSVINSHLLRGASLVLTELSVSDPRFWEQFRDQEATSFAGVPYTFDLLDRAGFADLRLPSLRYVTQAGGRLAPERVRRYAALGRQAGWKLFVMYGQTEATARIAYLPPELAEQHPQAIGVPVPGGDLRLLPVDGADTGPDTGELVYRGPNVMLGYARTPADLALGRAVTELRTGDIARRHPNGLFEIIGRRSRFAKVFGLRLDLQQIEDHLRRQGVTACCATDDDALTVVAETPEGQATGPLTATRITDTLTDAYGLPAHAIRVLPVDALPRLASGKIDYAVIAALATAPTEPALAAGTVRDVFAQILRHDDIRDDDTFVTLGGDSLSYIQASVRLEQAIGSLPRHWHTLTVRELTRIARTADETATGRPTERRRRTARLDTTVALRAIAIVLIVGSHIQVFDLPGGAHVLIGVAGYNFARFHLTAAAHAERVRHLARTLSRIILAAVTWIGAMYLLTDDYEPASIILLGSIFERGDATNYWWHFWFVEALVYFLLILLAAMRLPALDRLERRHPFALPAALAAAALIFRYQLVPGIQLPTPAVVFWLFALGWATAKADHRRQRLLISATVLATVPGLFGDAGREAAIILGLLALIWITDLPSLPALNRVAALLATSSMYIYLTHWQIFRPIDDTSRPLALAASLIFGVAYATVASRWPSKVIDLLQHARTSAARPLLGRRRAGSNHPTLPEHL